jgi:hypothetical protein
MSLSDSIQFPDFSINVGRVSFDDGQAGLSSAVHSCACRIADACKAGDDDALRLVRAYEHRLQVDDESDRSRIDAKVVCHSLAKVFHHGTWEEFKRSLDGELTEREATVGGSLLTQLHANMHFRDSGKRSRSYAKTTQALMESFVSAFAPQNILLEAIKFDEKGWHVDRPFVAGHPPALTETWSGTVVDLLDREIFTQAHIPRPYKPWDYRGPTGSQRYHTIRKKAGIVTQQLMIDLVPNNGIAPRLKPVSPEQEHDLVGATAVTIELVDALCAHHTQPTHDQVQAILKISDTLGTLLTQLEPKVPDADREVVFLECLRYALWIVRHVDVLAPFMVGDTVCNLLSTVHLALLSALTMAGLGRSPQTAAEKEVADSLPVTVTIPNALQLVPSFDWDKTPRRA